MQKRRFSLLMKLTSIKNAYKQKSMPFSNGDCTITVAISLMIHPLHPPNHRSKTKILNFSQK